MKPRINSRRILFLTGSRADYGKMKPLMESVRQHPGLSCSIAVTGMHLLPRYGLTATQIVRDGFTDLYTFTNQEPGRPARRDQIVADTLKGLSSIMDRVNPDMLVIHGDRPETLAGAVCGSMNMVLTAHVEGGELSGTIDETIRHAVSKLAHIHFVSNGEARKRLLQLGESENSIHIIGASNIDIMLSDRLPEIQSVREHYEIPFGKYIILLYHPDAFDLRGLKEKINRIINAIRESGRCCVAIFPNNEPGSEIIIDAYQDIKSENRFRVLPSMRFEYFLMLLKHADGIIGNSSSGIHEAPIYGVPTVNMGNRQRNRFQHDSITSIPETGPALSHALTRLGDLVGKVSRHFGDGRSSHRFMSALTGDDIWKTPTEKQLQDICKNLN